MERVVFGAVVALIVFAVSLFMTRWVRNVALSKGMLDVPNERSSHAVPIPRGGGVAIVLASLIGAIALRYFDAIDPSLLVVFLLAALPVAFVGFLDDKKSLRPWIRFTAHALAAVVALYILGGVPPIRIGVHIFDANWLVEIVAVIAIVWSLNLFNFMDGIDGIAASEALFVCIAGSLLDASSPIAYVAWIVGAASLGFLVWNWPPAKIFMGDAGSGYLGFVIAVLALAHARNNPVAIFDWLIIGGVFFVDATVTLIRRALRNESVSVAHRTHAYQWMSRRLGSHLQVTLSVQGINFGWLLPLAFACDHYPQYAVFILFVALTPLVIVALAAGAGRAEERSA